MGTAVDLAATNLTLRIGGARIVEDVSFEVSHGEFLGVIGANGAGKTTLFNLLSGLTTPTSGRVLLGGQDVTGWSPARRARAGLGRTFQTSSVFAALPVLENVRLAVQSRQGGSHRFWWPVGGRGDRTAARARESLARVGLERLADVPAAALSHGDKRKLELAILLATEPAVILLDEPMAGVSAADVPDLTALIRRVHEDGGGTVVMVEHHMDVVLGLADRVAVMHHGSLLAIDTPAAVMADDRVQASYLGEPL
jgi:branched-chain amino acid transport system ATP-binding protein